MKEYITDNNVWISSVSGTPVRQDGSVVHQGDADAISNPNYGHTTVIDHPDPTPPALDHAAQFRALVNGRAHDLDKNGKYLEASALRATVGE